MIGSIAAVVVFVAAGLALSAWSIRKRRGRNFNAEFLKRDAGAAMAHSSMAATGDDQPAATD